MNGIRVAQSGFKVSDPDYRQAYSSEWPVLNVVATGYGAFLKGEEIVRHNLGYYPAFLLFIDRAVNVQTLGTSSALDGFNDDFHVTKEGLFHTSNSTINVANIRYYIFNIDLEQKLESPNIELGDVETFRNKSEDTGVRFARSGKTLKSRRFIDQNIRDDAIIPLIHSVTPGSNRSITTTVTHDLGYPPKVFAYVFDPGAGGYRYGVSALDASVVATSTEVRYSLLGFNGEKDSIIILKDPYRLRS